MDMTLSVIGAGLGRTGTALMKAIPQDWLLVFDEQDGWAPLCAFLGKLVPTEPYPRISSKEEMRPMIEAMAARFSATMSDADRAAAIKTVRDTVHGRKE